MNVNKYLMKLQILLIMNFLNISKMIMQIKYAIYTPYAFFMFLNNYIFIYYSTKFFYFFFIIFVVFYKKKMQI